MVTDMDINRGGGQLPQLLETSQNRCQPLSTTLESLDNCSKEFETIENHLAPGCKSLCTWLRIP